MTKFIHRADDRPNSSHRAFSLVEVTLAVAIAALAVTTLMALMPISISTVRSAANTTLEARIVAQVVGELQLADWGNHDGGNPGKWANLELLLAKKWMFDDQGSLLDPDNSADITSRLVSMVRVSKSTSSVILPGGTTQSIETVGVIVDVAATNSADFSFSVPGSYRTVPAVLTRQFAN